jgi:hypothetical protein
VRYHELLIQLLAFSQRSKVVKDHRSQLIKAPFLLIDSISGQAIGGMELKEVMALRINIFKRSIKERKGKTIWMLGGRKTCNIIDQCTLYTNAG